jgi:origin recognition complex subunit 3
VLYWWWRSIGGRFFDTIISARFIQAVSELQLLGFIKPTQRKTDHVQRLTWGLC